MVKMTCQNCSIPKTEKMLNLICSPDKSQFFKNNLEHFKDVDNQFFYAVIYGIMHHRLNGRNITLENAENVLGLKFFIELKKK